MSFWRLSEVRGCWVLTTKTSRSRMYGPSSAFIAFTSGNWLTRMPMVNAAFPLPGGALSLGGCRTSSLAGRFYGGRSPAITLHAARPAKTHSRPRPIDPRRGARAARAGGVRGHPSGAGSRVAAEIRDLHPHRRHDEQRARRHAERRVADRRAGDHLQRGLRLLPALLPLAGDDAERPVHAQPRRPR